MSKTKDRYPQEKFFDRLKFYMWPFDQRYEDMKKGNLAHNLLRDFTAGLVVAMVAIPLAMGFAMASGLKPEQGIVGGAIAGLIGALFGGSKFQVYGPTAAFIPIIGGMMALYPNSAAVGHSFVVLASIIAGICLGIMGLFRLGRYVALVPHSIVVGFTIGIAVVIGLSQLGEALGIHAKLPYAFIPKITTIIQHATEMNEYAVFITVGTFVMTKLLMKLSVFIPAPLIALGAGWLLGETVWADKGLVTLAERYGPIPTDFWVFTNPMQMQWDLAFLGNLIYFVIAIIFVAAIESLLCSRMADRLAENKGLPYNPNKELWGQGWVNIVAPLLNGFPHTGALARTATNIRVGGRTPLAGILKCFLKLGMAVYLAKYLNDVPLACIAGIMIFVATGMVKKKEVKEVLQKDKFHTGLMAYTAIMVIMTDFLIGVATALLIYGVCIMLGIVKPVK